MQWKKASYLLKYWYCLHVVNTKNVVYPCRNYIFVSGCISLCFKSNTMNVILIKNVKFWGKCTKMISELLYFKAVSPKVYQKLETKALRYYIYLALGLHEISTLFAVSRPITYMLHCPNCYKILTLLTLLSRPQASDYMFPPSLSVLH